MQHLFSDFKPVTAAEWKAQVIKDLKGEPFDDLVWKNENGFDIQPFYTAEDLAQSYEPAFTHSDWEIGVAAREKSADAINAQFLKELNSGATAISLSVDGTDLDKALAGIQLNYIQATFYASAKSINTLARHLEKNYALNELRCSVFAVEADTHEKLEEWLKAASVFEKHKGIKTYCANALPFHNGNCLAYYEAAIILSQLNEYLNAGVHNKTPGKKIVIKTGVSSDYFIQMAKLRAIRRLWKILSAEYNTGAELHLIAETSATNKSISDNYNNLLRTTLEAMAAVSGGCNELIVNGFDLFLPVNPTLSERMAINQQLILKDESYLDKIADVACGSYYIERITDALAQRALETFKQFEAGGGYFACLEKNIFAAAIAQQAGERENLVNTQKQIAIGVNKFKNEKENIVLSAATINEIRQLHIHNPILNFELAHYFKQHA